MQIPFVCLIFQGIPESIALAAFVFTLARVDLSWKKAVIMGIFLALAMYTIRLLPITYGIHTIVLVILLIILVSKYGRVDVLLAVVSSLAGVAFLGVAETLVHNVVLVLCNISRADLMHHHLLRACVGLPQVLLIFLVTCLVKRYRRSKSAPTSYE